MDDLSPNQANRLSGAQGYWGTAFVLALIAHGLLFVLLFVSMQWRSEPTGPVYAELWNGDMPAAEAPAETQPEPQPEPEPEPQPRLPCSCPPIGWHEDSKAMECKTTCRRMYLPYRQGVLYCLW